MPRRSAVPKRRPPPRRLRDASVLLPFLGLFAWMPPIIGLFVGAGRIFGVPAIVAWLFGVWFALIVIALALSRRLEPDDEDAN